MTNVLVLENLRTFLWKNFYPGFKLVLFLVPHPTRTQFCASTIRTNNFDDSSPYRTQRKSLETAVCCQTWSIRRVSSVYLSPPPFLSQYQTCSYRSNLSCDRIPPLSIPAYDSLQLLRLVHARKRASLGWQAVRPATFSSKNKRARMVDAILLSYMTVSPNERFENPITDSEPMEENNWKLTLISHRIRSIKLCWFQVCWLCESLISQTDNVWKRALPPARQRRTVFDISPTDDILGLHATQMGRAGDTWKQSRTA